VSAVTRNEIPTASRHFAGISLNGPLAISLVAVSLVFLAVAVGFAGVVSSIFSGSIHDEQPRAVIDDLVVKHDKKTEEYAQRFNSRYIFYKPPPPPPPKRDPPPEPPKPVVEDTKPAGPPATYQGPSIVWVIGDDVYFNMLVPTQTEKYIRVRVGEERGGVKVLSTEKMPRTIRVAHMGGEYDVKVFGDAMTSSTLFPTSPRPSITVPGFIPVGQPAPAVEPAESTAAADESEKAAAAAVEARSIDAQPANGERRGSGRDRRGNSRGDRGERPDGGSPR